MIKIELRRMPMPETGCPDEAPQIPRQEYEIRLKDLYARAGVDWVVIYSDREHHANLTYLINYDPRFEEALLLLGPGNQRILVAGNEGMGYLSVIPVPLETSLCQSFSLGGQPRSTSANLMSTLVQAGMCKGQTVGLAGWKYLEAGEFDEPGFPAFVPALVLESIRRVTGQVRDVTAVLCHPETGMMAQASAHQIAACEWAARQCSAAVFGVVRSARPGMSEMRTAEAFRFSGLPFTMHPIVTSGKGEVNGLRSASDRVLEYGDAISTAVGYRGSLACRAGLLTGEVNDAFMREVVNPYFGVITSWYAAMRLGVSGGEIWRVVENAFSGSGLRSMLNPGHLTLIEEWVHTPMREDSSEKISSGMVFQADIIPTPLKAGWMMNCEDTLAVADAALRAEIRTLYPQMWARIEKRRGQMMSLGLKLADEILPLSDGAAYLPPFWLAPDLVCTAAE